MPLAASENLSRPCAGLALTLSEPSPTSAARLRWLTPLLAQQHRSPAFETPRENSLRCRRSEQRGFARRCYQRTRCTQLGGVVGYQGRHRVKRGFGSSCTAGIGSPLLPSTPLRNGLHHFFARRSEHLRSTLALLPLARGIWEFVIASLGGQVTGWVRRRWRLAKFSTPCAGLALSHSEPSDIGCTTPLAHSAAGTATPLARV